MAHVSKPRCFSGQPTLLFSQTGNTEAPSNGPFHSGHGISPFKVALCGWCPKQKKRRRGGRSQPPKLRPNLELRAGGQRHRRRPVHKLEVALRGAGIVAVCVVFCGSRAEEKTWCPMGEKKAGPAAHVLKLSRNSVLPRMMKIGRQLKENQKSPRSPIL